eukprot:9456640-Alexandrium_andersonii.AAC.1
MPARNTQPGRKESFHVHVHIVAELRCAVSGVEREVSVVELFWGPLEIPARQTLVAAEGAAVVT